MLNAEMQFNYCRNKKSFLTMFINGSFGITHLRRIQFAHSETAWNEKQNAG